MNQNLDLNYGLMKSFCLSGYWNFLGVEKLKYDDNEFCEVVLEVDGRLFELLLFSYINIRVL